jgi:transcriptional regulator with XRE-family HTH domain
MSEAGRCPACGTARLPRRGDPLCRACIQTARQPVARPLWLFDSAALRDALARVNLPAVLAIVRAATGLSQADLAAIAGWNPSTLSLYEHGHRDGIFDIRVLLQFADAVDLPREALLPLLLGSAGTAFAAHSDVDEATMDLDRRKFGGVAASAAVTALLPSFTMPPRITTSHVRYLQKCADTLSSRDQDFGGAALLRSGLCQWERARRMLKEASYTETVGREFMAVTGRLGACVGWLAFDGGQHALSQSLYSQAREFAEEAEDTVLKARLLGLSSLLASHLARTSGKNSAARDGLLLAYRAAEEARYEPLPRLHALIALRQAYAASLLGDKAVFRSGITRARRELGKGPLTDEPAWLHFVNDAEITGFEAQGHMDLGEPERSEELYRDTLAGDLAPRNRVFYQARLAGSLLQQGAVGQAVASASHVLPELASGIASVRTVRELRPIRAAATKADAAEFCQQFDCLERELGDLQPAS